MLVHKSLYLCILYGIYMHIHKRTYIYSVYPHGSQSAQAVYWLHYSAIHYITVVFINLHLIILYINSKIILSISVMLSTSLPQSPKMPGISLLIFILSILD